MVFHFLFHKKKKSPCSYTAPLSHLTFCTPNESSLYLANSLATVVSEPDLHRLPTFHVSNHMSLFYCLGHTTGLVQTWGTHICFVTRPVFMVRSYQHLIQSASWRTTPCPLSVTAYSKYSQYPPHWKPFPYPQSEDAPSHGDRDSWMYSKLNPYFLTKQNTTLHEAANNIQLLVSKCCWSFWSFGVQDIQLASKRMLVEDTALDVTT